MGWGYSNKSEKGTSIAFLDSMNTFNGWKTILNSKDAWVQYNSVDFGSKKLKKVVVKVKSANGGTIQIRLDKVDGPVVAELKVPKGTGWQTVDAKISNFQTGVHHLFVVQKDSPVEIDWVKFQ